VKQSEEAFEQEEIVGVRFSEGVAVEWEVVLWHIALLLSGMQYFLRACNITWGYHIEKGCSGKTTNLACFWDFNFWTMGARDMDMGRRIWRWEIGGLSSGRVARTESRCGWRGQG